MPGNVWEEIIYPFPNNGATVEVWKWIQYVVPHFIMNVKLNHVSKKPPVILSALFRVTSPVLEQSWYCPSVSLTNLAHFVHEKSTPILQESDRERISPQIAKFMGPTWGPPGACRPQMGPMLAPWTVLLSGLVKRTLFCTSISPHSKLLISLITGAYITYV